MATRFYFPSSGTAPISPTVDASWEASASTFYRAPAPTAKSNTALTNFTSAYPGTSTIQMCMAQFVSAQLDGNQTLDGSGGWIVRCLESAATVDAHIAHVIRVIGSDGSTVRGTLQSHMTTSTEMVTTAETRIRGTGQGITQVDALDGDYIVIELGVHLVTPVSAGTVTFRFGDPSAVADFAETAGLTTDLVPWYEYNFASPATGEPVFKVPGGVSSILPLVACDMANMADMKGMRG